jgi:enamine deaminase RidA (YjgF/YER057c/UK114 family)
MGKGPLCSFIIQLTVHLSRAEHFQPMNAVYLEFMEGHTPARTILGFQPWDENFLIQLQAVAHLSAP